MLATARARAEQNRCLRCQWILARVQNTARRHVTRVCRLSRTRPSSRAGQVVQGRSLLRHSPALPTLNQIQVPRAFPVHAVDAARPRPSTQPYEPTASGTPWPASVSPEGSSPSTTAQRSAQHPDAPADGRTTRTSPASHRDPVLLVSSRSLARRLYGFAADSAIVPMSGWDGLPVESDPAATEGRRRPIRELTGGRTVMSEVAGRSAVRTPRGSCHSSRRGLHPDRRPLGRTSCAHHTSSAKCMSAWPRLAP